MHMCMHKHIYTHTYRYVDIQSLEMFLGNPSLNKKQKTSHSEILYTKNNKLKEKLGWIDHHNVCNFVTKSTNSIKNISSLERC